MDEILKINNELLKNSPANDLLNEFIADCDVRPQSKETYRKGVKYYFIWLYENRIKLDDVDRKEIIRYKEWMEENANLSSATANTYLASVKKFYEWAESKKKYPNVAAGVKIKSGEKRFEKKPLTKEEVKILLSKLKERNNKRDFALVKLIIGTATRRIEVSRANIGDVEIQNGKHIWYLHGKGRSDKKDFVVIAPSVWETLDEYWKSNGQINKESPFFISGSNMNYGERLSTGMISRIVKQSFKDIGIDSKRYTCHSLRHTGAILMLDAGAPIERVQNVLRHYSIDTTRIYGKTHIERKRIEEAPEELINNILDV